MSEITYYQRNRDIIVNRAKEYYKNNKELLQERALSDSLLESRLILEIIFSTFLFISLYTHSCKSVFGYFLLILIIESND